MSAVAPGGGAGFPCICTMPVRITFVDAHLASVLAELVLRQQHGHGCLQVGAAAATKLALNQLIGSLTIAFSTSLGLLQRNNADIEKFMDILRPSALYAPTYDKKLQRMLDRDYADPNFTTRMLLKDMKLFQDEGRKSGLNPALLHAVVSIVSDAVDKGLDNTDYSAVHDAVIDPKK